MSPACRFPDSAESIAAFQRHGRTFAVAMVSARPSFDKIQKTLPGQDDVFFRPGMHFCAMRAAELVRLHFLVGPKLFFNHLASRREFRGGRTADENSFCHGSGSFR